VLGVSPDLVERMRRLRARDVRLAVVAAAPSSSPTRAAPDVRQELGDPPVLGLTVGRLAAQKDLDLLLDAVARIDPALGLTVAVAGDGPERPALEERIARESLPVRLLGARDDVPDLLAAADLVISSARWEGQPVWLQEAMRAGRPAVATDVGGTAGIVGGGGLLVPHGDPSALRDAIERVAGDPELRQSLAAQADSRGRELPDRAAAVTDAEAVYDDMRHSPPDPRR
jgi:glycosyltransferase involved in cell wall biosynthesis